MHPKMGPNFTFLPCQHVYKYPHLEILKDSANGYDFSPLGSHGREVTTTQTLVRWHNYYKVIIRSTGDSWITCIFTFCFIETNTCHLTFFCLFTCLRQSQRMPDKWAASVLLSYWHSQHTAETGPRKPGTGDQFRSVRREPRYCRHCCSRVHMNGQLWSVTGDWTRGIRCGRPVSGYC